jgi:pyruvate dehydrogenase E2 component (dihydrolipoamide acetyltransferase)
LLPLQPSSAVAAPTPVLPVPAASPVDEITTIAVKGVRKIIAERMLASLQTTAQLTLNSSADARTLQSLRKRFKESPEMWGLRGVTINDLVLFAVAHSLPQHPDLNALFADSTISQYKRVHLGVAVDTPRGLLVPVVRNADTLTLKQLAAEAKRLAAGAQIGKLNPDELSGGTFTVTNLGSFGVESFTPVLNPPQVAILGVSGISLKAVEAKAKAEAKAEAKTEAKTEAKAEAETSVEFVPHIGLSLTINHQVVDGAPAARFLQTLAQAIAQIDLLLAG